MNHLQKRKHSFLRFCYNAKTNTKNTANKYASLTRFTSTWRWLNKQTYSWINSDWSQKVKMWTLLFCWVVDALKKEKKSKKNFKTKELKSKWTDFKTKCIYFFKYVKRSKIREGKLMHLYISLYFIHLLSFVFFIDIKWKGKKQWNLNYEFTVITETLSEAEM